MSRPIMSSRLPAAAAALAMVLAGCNSDPTGIPTTNNANVAIQHWSDTLVVGSTHALSVHALDSVTQSLMGKPVMRTVGKPVTWTIDTPSVLSAAVDGDSVRLTARAPGVSNIVFQIDDPNLADASVTRQITVVVGGVALTHPSIDTTLRTIGQTLRLTASALGYNGGNTLTPLASQGLTWTRQGPGAVSLAGTGDTVTLTAEQEGIDTVVVTHAHCLAGAPCADTAIVTVSTAPTPGADVVVFNDIDMWSNDLVSDKPENQVFFANLVSFTGSGPRASGTTVMFYNGSSSTCGQYCADANSWYTNSLGAKLTALNYSVVNESSSLASIPSGVKVVFIFLPNTRLGTADVNGLKQFAGEGGRVVVVGENPYYYGGTGIENQLLADLGTSIVSTEGCAAHVKYVPTVGMHQITSGISQIYMGCASPVAVGAGGYILVRDTDQTPVGAVAKIDLTPLP